jgi:hypothetical protein
MEHANLEGWRKKNLRSSDHVVLESTTNAWHVYDLLPPLVWVAPAHVRELRQLLSQRSFESSRRLASCSGLTGGLEQSGTNSTLDTAVNRQAFLHSARLAG